MLSVSLSHRVSYAWHDDKLKVLVSLDEGVDHLHCRCRIHIVIELSDHKHQRTCKEVGVLDVRSLLILVADRVAEPLLVPPDLVHSVVVASACRVCALVELRMEEHRSGRLLTAGRASEDADSVYVHVWILLGCSLDPELSVRDTCVLEVLVAYFLEFLRAV